MKISQIIGFLSVIICFFSFTQTDWKRFTSYEGKFSVLSPAELQEKVNNIETEVGTMAYHSFFYQPIEKEPENFIYMISYVDYPEAAFHPDSTEVINDFFETTIAGAVESLNGELRYSNEVSLNDNPGRIWRIDYINGEAVMKTKAFLAGNRYYSIQVASHKDKSLNNDMDKFLDSFKIIE